MIETTIDIKKFKEKFEKELGAVYPLVERIWKEICEKGFSAKPHEELGSKEQLVAACTELEIILLTCITYMQDGEEKVALIKSLLLLVCKNHKVAQGAKIEIRKSFLIVIVN